MSRSGSCACQPSRQPCPSVRLRGPQTPTPVRVCVCVSSGMCLLRVQFLPSGSRCVWVCLSQFYSLLDTCRAWVEGEGDGGLRGAGPRGCWPRTPPARTEAGTHGGPLSPGNPHLVPSGVAGPGGSSSVGQGGQWGLVWHQYCGFPVPGVGKSSGNGGLETRTVQQQMCLGAKDLPRPPVGTPRPLQG